MREAIKLHPVPTVPTVPRVEETILTHSRRKCRPWHNSGGALGHNVMEQTEPTQREFHKWRNDVKSKRHVRYHRK